MNIHDLKDTPVTDLVPHRAPMLFLDRVSGLKGDVFEAHVDLTEQSPMIQAGAVPVWVGLEYMAQATAAYAGAEGRSAGKGPKVGMLLGTRDYRATVPSFALGQSLSIQVRKVISQANGVSAVDGVIADAHGTVLATAQLTVIEIEDLSLVRPHGGSQ